MNNNSKIVYLNGLFTSLEDAKVPVLDRGFIFGDGVYEVIPVYGGKPFRLPQHLQRLANSLEAIRITNPTTEQQWENLINELIERNNWHDQSVYLQVTRGVAPRDHGFPEDIKETIFLMSNPLLPPSEEVLKNGVKAITLKDNRWLNCHIKAIALLPNILLRQEAMDKGAMEAILLRDGFATEGAASNLFIVTAECIFTPPRSPLLLAGITRDLIIEIAQKADLCIKEQDISEQQLIQADEIWLSSSTKEILPVTSLNDRQVGSGNPGIIWQQMYSLYQNYKQALTDGQ